MSSEWAAFTTLEHDDRSFAPEDVPGDGNCFYHCAIRSTAIPYVDVGDLRRDVCAFALGAGRPAAERAVQLLGYKTVDENGKSASLSFTDAAARMGRGGVQVTNVEMILVRLLFNVNVVSLSNYATGIEEFSADEFCAKHLKMYVPFGPAPRSMTVFRHVLSQPLTPVPRSDDDLLNHFALLWPATTTTAAPAATPAPTSPEQPEQASFSLSNDERDDDTPQVVESAAQPKTSPKTTPTKRKRASRSSDSEDVPPAAEVSVKPAVAAAKAPAKRTRVSKSPHEKEPSEPTETPKLRTTSRQAALQKKEDLVEPVVPATEPVDNSSSTEEEVPPAMPAVETVHPKKLQTKQQKEPKPRKTTIVKKAKTVWAPGTKPKEQTWERRALLVAFHLHDDLGARDFSLFTSVFGESVSPETLRNWLRKENVAKWMPIVKDVTKRDLMMGVVPEDKRSLFENKGSDGATVSQKALSKYISFALMVNGNPELPLGSQTTPEKASSTINVSVPKRAHRMATSGRLGRPVKHAIQEKFASDTIKSGFEKGSPVFFNEVLSAVRTAFSDKEKFASFQKVLASDKQIRTWLRRVFQRMDVSEHERVSRMR